MSPLNLHLTPGWAVLLLKDTLGLKRGACGVYTVPRKGHPRSIPQPHRMVRRKYELHTYLTFVGQRNYQSLFRTLPTVHTLTGERPVTQVPATKLSLVSSCQHCPLKKHTLVQPIKPNTLTITSAATAGAFTQVSSSCEPLIQANMEQTST